MKVEVLHLYELFVMNLVSLSRSTDCIPAEREPATPEELRRQQLMEFDAQNFCAKNIRNHNAQKNAMERGCQKSPISNCTKYKFGAIAGSKLEGR